MKGITSLGAACSIAILLTVQLLFGIIMDTCGLFGLTKIALSFNKVLGLLTMIVGISFLVFTPIDDVCSKYFAER